MTAIAAPPTTGRPRELRQNPYVQGLLTPRGIVGLVLVGGIALAGLLAPLLAPASPTAQSADSLTGLLAAGHPLGTDDLGRDVLSRVLYGIRSDLWIIAAAVPLGALLGVGLALAATTARVVDTVVQRIFDLIFAFPGLVLALAVTAIVGPGAGTVVLVVALAEIPVFGRQLRAAILVHREREYAVAAAVGGASRQRVLVRHILPNAADPLIVQIAVSLSVAVFIEGGMSYLGVGVVAPAPSLGNILASAVGHLGDTPSLALVPLAVVTLLVLGLSLLAEALNQGVRR
ncbi:ABC transporter permease [Streptomyces sp. Q6]|uniref:ABC transporter permease n=1 Tax=Streptomyces citrinus TaxID=3118173 RepID=A0ACD5APS2_9ACTN